MINDFQFDMKYDTIDVKNNNIDRYISTVKYFTNDINHISFDNMTSLFKNYRTLYLASDKSFDTLIKDKIDGIKYFQDKDLMIMPTIVYNIMDKDPNINYPAIISFYNLNKNNIWGFNVPTIVTEKLPDITASKMSKVERKYHFSNTDLSILFDNLPQSLYNNVVIEEQGIMYDIDKKEYFTQTMNQEELFKRIETIAINGFSKPLEMLISEDGLIPLNNSQEDFLIALYLNLPSIPVAFISSGSTNEYIIKRLGNKEEINYQSNIIKRVDNSFNKEDLQTILEPYFIFD